MIRIARILSFAACVLAGTSLLAQTEFSADVVNNDKSGTAHATKMYFGKDKLRIEGAGHGNGRDSGVVIMDMNAQSWLILMPEQHMYMDMPKGQESKEMFSYFRTGDVDNACTDWLKIERNKGGTCHKVGSETVNGRSTVKYEGTNSKGETSQVWLDSKLRFPVKWTGSNEHGGELQNIKEGAQPASLFEIPAGYNKMDIGAMQGHQHN